MDCAAKIPGVPGVPATAAATCETNLTVTLSPSFSCVSEVDIKSWPLRLSVKAVLPEVFRLTVMVAPFAIGNLFFPCGTVFTFTVTESSAVGVPTTTPVTVISTRLAAPTVDCGLGVLLAAGVGVCQDHAHIFISAARACGIPARYITGYLLMDESHPAEAHHAWAEAWIEGLGWVGFDVANCICPTEKYVRLAAALDAYYAAPVRGSRRGGDAEKLDVAVNVRHEAAQQSQTQQ